MSTSQQNINRILQRLDRAIDRRLEATRTVVEGVGEEGEQFMQANAPWQDRPDDRRPKGLPHARQLLRWKKRHPPRLRDGARISWVHGATYGRFLETSHGSRFQILGTTRALYGPLLLDRLRRKWT